MSCDDTLVFVIIGLSYFCIILILTGVVVAVVVYKKMSILKNETQANAITEVPSQTGDTAATANDDDNDEYYEDEEYNEFQGYYKEYQMQPGATYSSDEYYTSNQ